MSELVRARVTDAMQRLRLRSAAERLDAVLAEAARKEPTYLDFLDGLLREEIDAKQKRRVSMGIKIAHFPVVKTFCCSDRRASARRTSRSHSGAPPSKRVTLRCS